MSAMTHPATARRLEWRFLPTHIRALIEEHCGSPVVEADSQPRGFTPGFASVLTCADGSRHFVKAASVKAQRMIAGSYREEARKLAMLPAGVPAPRLLWSHDDDWVVLGIEYVDAANPARPWRPAQLDACLDALEAMVPVLTPPPDGLELDTFANEYADEDHDLSDFGQRWFDGRRQFFYSPDQAPMDDPTALLGDPGLQATYSYANANPLAFVDPDGRAAIGILSATQRKQLRHDLRSAGVEDPELQAKIRTFFGKHTRLGGKAAFTLLSNYSRLKKIQEFADKWDMKPIVQFELDFDGALTDMNFSLTNIKFGFGAGPRAKLDFAKDDPGVGLPAVPANGLNGGAALGGAAGQAADAGAAAPSAALQSGGVALPAVDDPPSSVGANAGNSAGSNAGNLGGRSDGGE